jgi:two-component system sensor histidine kinase CpxA
MRKLEAVVRHFGSGELAARTPAASGDAIGRLARAFNQMADRIETLVASHQSLCADMAHELRSPLARLMLAARGVRRGAEGSVERVEQEATRINDLVSQLLDVSRAEIDPAGLDSEPTDLESLLTEIADYCRIEAAEKRCEIDLSFCHAGMVVCDGELLRRAVENVLRNAIRHAPEDSRIELSGGGEPDEVWIVVRDWGPGVPEHALGSIFKPFCRLGGAGRNGSGVGLGLSIAQRAISLHRGTICAENCWPGLRIVMRIPRR